MGLVHDVADGQLSGFLILLHLARCEVDENEVVDAGDEAFHHHAIAFLATVLHGHKAPNLARIEVFLDLEFAVISHANGVLHLLLSSFFYDGPHFHECKDNLFFVKMYHLLPLLVIYNSKQSFIYG